MPRPVRLAYIAILALITGVFLYYFKENLPGGSNPVIAGQPSVAMATMYMGKTLQQQFITPQVRAGIISFPLSVLLEKKIICFDYEGEKSKIPVLAFISAEGKLVTAIRMCEPCNSSEFRIEGTEMVCGRCGTRWKLNNLEGVDGTCQKYPPDPIPSRLVDGQVEIDETVLKNWKMRI
ncbi:MAG TPA: Fe-S-containing protein [Bacteroidota bacterium]|nr:Fe-S-containing protein [Bacteroidota bacterium]